MIIAVLNIDGGPIPSFHSSNRDLPSSDLEIVEKWPAVEIEGPPDVPPNVERFFIQGMINLRGRHWDAAGAMFRKALDVATKIICPEARKKTLFARIEQLVEAGLLTEAMGEWSHEIRIDGNDAVHDEEPETEEDAQAIQKFTDAFLRYSFTLPSLVEENRKKREAKA